MSAKSIRFHQLARYKMFAGVNMLADLVKVTLEFPCGAPTATKDGVSVAKEIGLKDGISLEARE